MSNSLSHSFAIGLTIFFLWNITTVVHAQRCTDSPCISQERLCLTAAPGNETIPCSICIQICNAAGCLLQADQCENQLGINHGNGPGAAEGCPSAEFINSVVGAGESAIVSALEGGMPKAQLGSLCEKACKIARDTCLANCPLPIVCPAGCKAAYRLCLKACS